jgi:hypothetical protein
MRGELHVKVTRSDDKPGAASFVTIDLQEEEEELVTDYLLRDKVVHTPPFRGQVMLPEEWIVPLYEALQEYVREHYA